MNDLEVIGDSELTEKDELVAKLDLGRVRLPLKRLSNVFNFNGVRIGDLVGATKLDVTTTGEAEIDSVFADDEVEETLVFDSSSLSR